jgi:hypothetical protein
MIDRIRDHVIGSGTDCEILAHNITGGAGYLAIRDIARGEVSALIVLIDRYQGDLGFKIMGEDMGPFYYGAGPRVLKALTPTIDPRALEWRARCHDRNQKIARVRGDLTGKRIALWGGTYKITGRPSGRSRSWQGVREDSGVIYLIRPSQVKEADLLD